MECNLKQLVCAGMCAVALLVLSAADSLAASPGVCISDDEAELLGLIDQYRVQNQLPKIPWSKSLTTVAQWHVIDAAQNEDTVFNGACNLHSWSNMHPQLWSAVCYTADHTQASKMYVKPKEITGGLFRSNGYEIGGWGYRSVAAMMVGWQTSAGHNEVILNQGGWSNFPWKSMGVGVDLVNRYYYVWFSNVPDPQGQVPRCSIETGFNSSFE